MNSESKNAIKRPKGRFKRELKSAVTNESTLSSAKENKSKFANKSILSSTKENKTKFASKSILKSAIKQDDEDKSAIDHRGNNSTYLSGFGSYFTSEAIEGALPVGQNSPQRPPFGLYAEQLSGSAFTAQRACNLRSWLYRIYPSVVHGEFRLKHHDYLSNYMQGNLQNNMQNYEQNNLPNYRSSYVQNISPNQLRWKPIEVPSEPTNFVEGLIPWVSNGSAEMGTGACVYLYAFNRSMEETFFYNADGELLIVPEMGTLNLLTEFGGMWIEPGEIAVIPRGVKFQVRVKESEEGNAGNNGPKKIIARDNQNGHGKNTRVGCAGVGCARGYVLENYGQPLRLPELGPIGANGLAQPRDFLFPKAQYFDLDGQFKLIAKFQGALWEAEVNHHPLDVVAWHGNYAPYKYDLRRFNTINTVSFDHPDPSIFTVLTSPSECVGVANVDFVIFPERWMVAEGTFRPPYFHRNIMNEYMGLIYGAYDAKPDGFLPGGGSLHNCMSAHGPDANAFEKAVAADTSRPERLRDTLAFMFEGRAVWRPTEYAMREECLDKGYRSCWEGLRKRFDNKIINLG